MEKLVSSLPLHLLAVCLEHGQGLDLAYVLRGMRFLHSLSELATRHTRLEQVTSFVISHKFHLPYYSYILSSLLSYDMIEFFFNSLVLKLC
jgi:hypothetical protein